MPNHWLLKTEPSDYSFADLERDKRTVWEGVANPLALKHLRLMKRGDLAFVYHTGAEKQIVGIAEVVSDPIPDRRSDDPRLVVVGLAPNRRLKKPVTLAEIKGRPEFAGFDLVRIGRLSVMPVSDQHWKTVCELGE
jgi:predicted RNA-binding protein with PUA-like domain